MWPLERPETDEHRYEPLADQRSNSEQSDMEKSSLEEARPTSHRRTNHRRQWCPLIAVFLNVLLFATSATLFLALSKRESSTNYILKQINPYTPVLDDIEVPIISKKVRGELFPAQDPSEDYIGRLEPGPGVDEMWEDYEVQRMFVLSREQVLAMGKDPEMTVRYPDADFGLGDEAYMAGMDIFHVLHCFNAVRQEAFKDYYFDGVRYHMAGYSADVPPKRRHTEMYWLHLRHCVDIVTQALMCHADASMVTMTWLEEQNRPWPDFSVEKKCVDFDRLVRWRDEHAMDVRRAGGVTKPEEVRGSEREVRIDEQYWAIFGNGSVRGDKFHHPLWEVDEKGWPVGEGEEV